MKKKNCSLAKVAFYILTIVIFTSCTKTWITIEDDQNYIELFNSMWTEIRDNYIFFDQKDVNWQELRGDARLKLTGIQSQESAFTIFSEMLSKLKDGHVSLYTPFNKWLYHDFYLDFPENYYEGVIMRNYLSEINEIGPFIYGILDNNIGYLRYSSFGDEIEIQHLKYLSDYFKETKGLVIDVRGNLGGASDNVAQLLKFVLKKDHIMGKIYTKNRDVISIADHTFEAAKEFEPYHSSMVVLTNRKCYSSCNLFVAYISQLDGVAIVGDTTGGGSGIAIAKELSNGWHYRYSAGKISLADGTEIENGVIPDINISTDENNALNGSDAILDAALNHLK